MPPPSLHEPRPVAASPETWSSGGHLSPSAREQLTVCADVERTRWVPDGATRDQDDRRPPGDRRSGGRYTIGCWSGRRDLNRPPPVPQTGATHAHEGLQRHLEPSTEHRIRLVRPRPWATQGAVTPGRPGQAGRMRRDRRVRDQGRGGAQPGLIRPAPRERHGTRPVRSVTRCNPPQSPWRQPPMSRMCSLRLRPCPATAPRQRSPRRSSGSSPEP